MLNSMLSAWSGRANFSQKKCAPSFLGQARKALGKAIDSVADNREGMALFLVMSAWIAVMTVYALA